MSQFPKLMSPFEIPEIKEYLNSLGNQPKTENGIKLNNLSLDELYQKAIEWKTKQNTQA